MKLKISNKRGYKMFKIIMFSSDEKLIRMENSQNMRCLKING